MKVLTRNTVRKSFLAKVLLVFGVTLIGSTVTPASANAAVVHKSFRGVLNGFESQRWWDDTVGHGNIQTSGCSTNHGTAAHRTLVMEAWHDRGWLPNQRVGSGDARSCYWGVANTGYYAHAKGNYYFRVTGFQNWQRVSGNTRIDF